MKGTLIRLQKNEFTNKSTGEVVRYCKLTLLSPVNTDSDVGYAPEIFTTKAENFGILKKMINTAVTYEVDYVQQTNGLYKKKIKKINDVVL